MSKSTLYRCDGPLCPVLVEEQDYDPTVDTNGQSRVFPMPFSVNEMLIDARFPHFGRFHTFCSLNCLVVWAEERMTASLRTGT